MTTDASNSHNIDGTCDPRMEDVRAAFTKNFDDGLEVGASVCVIKDGETLVDLWGGHVDEAKTAPWTKDTITNVWSTTKTMTALSALILGDRGELNFDAPVATYWPEFKANGKEDVLVRHLMAHTAGLPAWEEPITEEDTWDWEKCTSLLASQAPWWEPGTKSGYHALTQGYLVGEVVRRVAGETVGTFFRNEVAQPLGADFHIGLASEHDHRVARVIPPPTPLFDVLDPNANDIVKRMGNPAIGAEASWTEGWRRAEVPAAGGHGNARSVATAQSALSHGGTVNGTTILSEAGCHKVFEEQCYGIDLVLGMSLRHGIGYGLNSPEMPIGGNDKTCFWGGWGGSIIINDLESKLTIAYVMNKMGEGTTGDLRGGAVAFAAMIAASSL